MSSVAFLVGYRLLIVPAWLFSSGCLLSGNEFRLIEDRFGSRVIVQLGPASHNSDDGFGVRTAGGIHANTHHIQ